MSSRMASVSAKSDYDMKFPPMFFTKNEMTFQYDDSRPSLPVPSLQQTLKKYLDSVKLHLNQEEYNETKKIVEDFALGQGRDLHAKLIEKAKHNQNWLEKWWDEQAYLSFREPHNPYVNFTGPSPVILKAWPLEEGSQVKRASMVLWGVVKYWQLLYKEKLAIDKGGMKEKNIWSMSQFRRMFNSCKIPGEKMDSFRFHFETESEGPPLTDVLIFCRGRIFYFSSTDGQGEPLTVPEFEHQLQKIYNKCEGQPEGQGLGCLTGHNRTEFYKAREHLLSLHPDNKHYLDIIEKAMVGLALDEDRPGTLSEICHYGLVGNSKNRWFDKSMTHIVFKNGAVSCNCDHAPHDAMVMVSSALWNQLVFEKNGYQWKGPTTVRQLPEPEELVFKLDSRMHMYMEDALRVFKHAGDRIEICSAIYTGYGRKLMRQFGVHPDTHCQIAGQFAYYRIYGRPAATYETASTRKYYNARTETVRSCTAEAYEFAKAMMDDNATKVDQLMLLEAAYNKHNQMMVECQNGMGIDRHLFGLQMIATEEGSKMPEIFTDPAFTKSGGGGNYTLSTSFVGYTDVYGGVAPMCKDGIGQFYAIQNEGISYFCSTWKEDTTTNGKMFYETVCKCLDDMRALLEYKEKYHKININARL